MKNLLLGILLVAAVIIGGVVYRNAAEHPSQPIVCPMDALVCPDGTSVSRTGTSCTFPVCPPPNVSLPDISLAFALPDGFTTSETPDASSIAAYASPVAASSTGATIVIRRYALDASTTPLAIIRQTAISGTSGLPVPATSLSSSVIDGRRFTIVTIERFEGTIDTAYYLSRGTDVLRFDAIDTGVSNWTDSSLTVGTLPGHAALTKLLLTLQGQ